MDPLPDPPASPGPELPAPSPPRPTRRVIQAEALAWLAQTPAEPGTSVITSLPDLCELPEKSLEAWKAWFVDAAAAVLRWVPDEGAAIFYQSDIRHRGLWVDKAYLVQRAAEATGSLLLQHTIVCRKPPGTLGQGRASYSHLLCFSRSPLRPRRPRPDVLPDAGLMVWPKAMGVEACRLACQFLLQETATRLVVDPFCGRGTVLAVANALGLDALGVDLSAKRCRNARSLTLPPET
ncbi:MAG: hypothetical protein U0359_01695 [Byssovorax sp.]